MTREVRNALFVLFFTSPFDAPAQWWFGKKEKWPHPVDLQEISSGSSYHKAKGYWAQSFRDDGEWWSKLCRFIIWWETALVLLLGVLLLLR